MRFWFTFDAPRGTYAVWLVPSTHPALAPDRPGEQPCLGITVYADRAIYINDDVPVRVQNVTALHEKMHACLDGAGLPPKTEERVVNVLDARLLGVIRRHGYRLPPRPRRRRRPT